MRFLTGILLVWLSIVKSGDASNILFLAPLASPSHHNWNRNLYLSMVNKGHNVTVLSPDVDQEVVPNLHYIHLEGVYEGMHNDSEDSIDLIEFAKLSEWKAFSVFWHWVDFNNRLVAESKGFQWLLNYPDTFNVDLIVIDYTICSFLLGFVHKFNYPPTVAVTAFGVPHYFTHTFGGHRHPGYIAHHGSRYSTDMTFMERIYNHIFYLIDDYYYFFHLIPSQNKLLQEWFKDRSMPSLEKLQTHLGLALVNVHPAVEEFVPLASNMIPIGGLQIKEPKALDSTVKSFIEAGKKGTILFSLGTNVKSEMLDDKMKQMIISVFSELSQYNFLWKYESDLKQQLPKNVMIKAWLKQNDILAHTNLKAFISHCGLMSTQEATWRGVPIIGLPFFADQRRNGVGIVNRGTGVVLDIFTLTRETFKAALLEVLENAKYSNNAKTRARVFQDQQEKPLDRAIFWLEWTMRHKNDLHVVQSSIRTNGTFIGNSYDVLLLVSVSVLVLICLVKMMFCGKKVRKVTKEKLN